MTTDTYNVRPIPERERYHADTAGVIFNHRQRNGRPVLTPISPFEGNGTPMVKLRGTGTGTNGRNVSVAGLILDTFAGPRPTPRHVPNHVNGIITDNRASNLTWGTRAGCNLIAAARGRATPTNWESRTPDERDVIGFAHGYTVDPAGIVRSYRQGSRRATAKRISRGGYITTQLERSAGKCIPTNVGPLVLTAHDRPPQAGEVCRYRDGIPSNVTLDNLYWAPRKGNPKARAKGTASTDASVKDIADAGTSTVANARANYGAGEQVRGRPVESYKTCLPGHRPLAFRAITRIGEAGGQP